MHFFLAHWGSRFYHERSPYRSTYPFVYSCINFVAGIEPIDDTKKRLHDMIMILEEVAKEKSTYPFWEAGI